MKFSSKDSRVFFYVVLVFTGFVAYQLFQPYIATIFFSIVIVVIFKPVYDAYMRWFKQRNALATTVTILTIFIAIIIPLAVIISLTIDQAIQFRDDLSSVVAGKNVTITVVIEEINKVLEEIPYTEDYLLTEAKVIETLKTILKPVATFLANSAVNVGSLTTDFISKFVIFLAILAALFPGYPQFIQLIKDLSPLDDELDARYIDQMTVMTRSMVKGVFIIALIQGLVSGILYWIADVPYIFFWTLLACFLSIFPIGAQFISIPMGIILLITGNIWQGLVVIIGSLIIVGNIDNFLRPYLVPKETDLNTALVLLSVFGGIHLLGFFGVIYGPVIMIFLVTTIEIYLEHYRAEHNL